MIVVIGSFSLMLYVIEMSCVLDDKQLQWKMNKLMTSAKIMLTIDSYCTLTYVIYSKVYKIGHYNLIH